jgi:hypothetical protein
MLSDPAGVAVLAAVSRLLPLYAWFSRDGLTPRKSENVEDMIAYSVLLRMVSAKPNPRGVNLRDESLEWTVLL